MRYIKYTFINKDFALVVRGIAVRRGVPYEAVRVEDNSLFYPNIFEEKMDTAIASAFRQFSKKRRLTEPPKTKNGLFVWPEES